jgi:hypothetical protein
VHGDAPLVLWNCSSIEASHPLVGTPVTAEMEGVVIPLGTPCAARSSAGVMSS